jgi:hypothetical protein
MTIKKNKSGKNKPRTKKVQIIEKIKVPKRRMTNPMFGAVSSINTAPVAIGNSLRGTQPRVIHTTDGCRVVGRDFAYSPLATGTISTWTLVGGMPLTPACLISSVVKNTSLMYNKFRFNKVRFHYITSSSTATTGDIIFYVRKNEGSGMPDCSSTSFLPYVLSDSNTVIGPQWTNHTFEFNGNSSWLETDYGATSESERYSDHDVFLFSKTSSTDSPGYVLIDYDISFREVCTLPRSGALTNYAGVSAQWEPLSMVFSGAVTSGTTVLEVTSFGNVYGQTVNLNYNSGDVFECVLDVQNSVFTNCAASTFAVTTVAGTNTVGFTLKTGTVCYLVGLSGHFRLYSTKDNAYTNANPWLAGVTATITSTTIISFVKRIGSVDVDYLGYSQ